MSSRTLKITYTGDARGVLGAIKQIDEAHASFGDRLRQTGQKISSAGTSLTKGLTLPIVGFGIAAVKAFTDGQQVIAQTEAAIKSTGGAANVTGKEVANLATKIQNYSGMSDEAVASGENLLLTFTNIRNSAGKGNDIFTQSTKLLADMSVAMGTDMSSSAIQLGKALNDPVAGITALTRVGVAFDEQTKKQIETLVKQGDTMEAQKIILAELSKEFGGSAKAAGETAAGAFNIAKEKIDNSMEKIGKAILKVAGPVLEDLASGIQGALKWFNQLDEGTKETIVKVAALVAAIGPVLIVVGKLTSAVGTIIGVFGKMGGALNALGSVIGVSGGLLTGYIAILAAAAVAVGIMTGKIEGLTDAMGKEFAQQLKQNPVQLENFRKSLNLVSNELLLVGGQVTKFSFAIQDMTGSTRKQTDTLIAGLHTLDEFGIQLSDNAEAAFRAYLKINDYSGALHVLKNALQPAIGAMKNMLTYTEATAEAAADAAQRVNGLADAFGNVAKAPKPSGGLPTGGHLPLQHGGIVTRPTVALIGEAGPEAVIPLSRGRGGSGGMVTNLYVTIPGTIVGPGGFEEVADILLRYLQKHGIRNVTAGIP